MPVRQNKQKRRERYERELERQIEEATTDKKSGQFCVYDKQTKKKYKGLNWKQAVDLWNELGSAIILDDGHVKNNR